jgi:hypothetical protein
LTAVHQTDGAAGIGDGAVGACAERLDGRGAIDRDCRALAARIKAERAVAIAPDLPADQGDRAAIARVKVVRRIADGLDVR